jgi:ABC-type glycerol-3-phosphate transport system substrate-binding protein
MMTNKNLPIISFLIIVMLIIQACGLASNEAEAVPTFAPTSTATATVVPSPTISVTPVGLQGTVHLWHSWGERQSPVLYQIVQDFRMSNPDVLFDILYVPLEDLRDAYQLQASQGGGPTLLMGPAEWGPALFDAALIADQSALADETLLANLNQPSVSAARYKGALLGLPYSLRGVILFRNRRLIPRSAETFEELISLATAANQGEQVGAFLERSFFYSGAHLNGLGGRLFNQDGFPAFNDQYGLAWLELLSAFELAGPPSFLSGDDIDRFLAGDVGLIIDGTWNMTLLAETLGPENLVIDPWPTYESSSGIVGTMSGYVQSDNIFLNSRASGDTLEANWAFVEYFLSQDVQTSLTQVGFVPAASNVQIVDITSGHLFNEAVAALAGGTAYPIFPEMEIYSVQMDITLRTYFDGAQAVDALRAAEDSIQRQLETIEATPTPTQ